MAHDLILHEAIVELHDRFGAGLDAIRVSRAVVGLYFTGMALDCGTAGACHTPLKTAVHETCCPMGAQVMPFPGTLRGRPTTELLEYAQSPNLTARAIGIATMNALAELCWQRRPHPGVDLRSRLDAFDAAAIRPEEHVVLVGAFIPFLRALKQMHQPYTVLELSTAMLKPEELPHYRPAADAAGVIPRGDVVLLTGSTLLTNTLDDLLRMCRPDARVVVVGPTVGLLPEPLLRRGVDMIGGIRVVVPDTFLDVLAEGGSGAHFFERSAERVVLERCDPKPVAT
ncbi:MAG: Rossmann-like domain-containing protein [Rhodopila sp.]